MIVHLWNRLETIAVGLLVGTALLLSMYEIGVRYFFPQFAYDWGEEVIVYLVIWGVWLSTSALVEEDRHVRADIVIRLLPVNGQRAIELLNSVAAIVFCCLVIWYAWDMISLSRMLEERSGSSLRFPIWIYYSALPVGAALMILRYVRRIWLLAFRYDPATMQIGESVHGHAD